MAFTEEGRNFFGLMKNFLRFNSIEDFSDLTVAQFEFFMASIKYDNLGDNLNYYDDMTQRAEQLGVEIEFGQ